MIRPEETLCTALLFLHRYQRWIESQPEKDLGLDHHVRHRLPERSGKLTLIAPFASLRFFGVKGYRTPSSNARDPRSSLSVNSLILVQKSDSRIINPDKPALTFPSDLYDALRFSTVTSELIMLRVLKFELRVTLPQTYLLRLIPRCLPPDDNRSEDELKQTTIYRWTQNKIVQA